MLKKQITAKISRSKGLTVHLPLVSSYASRLVAVCPEKCRLNNDVKMSSAKRLMVAFSAISHSFFVRRFYILFFPKRSVARWSAVSTDVLCISI